MPQRPGGRARRGDFILRTPDAHPLLGVVLEGEVEMISEDSSGKKSLLSVLPVGSIFGESYTCAKARNRTIAYQARTHSRVLLLDLWADSPRLQAGLPVSPPDD